MFFLGCLAFLGEGVKSFSVMRICHSTCHRYMRMALDRAPLYVHGTRSGMAIRTWHSTRHRYMRMALDLAWPYAHGT